MPIIHPYRNFHPDIAPDVFVAENATIIGEVEIGAQSSVWFQAVIRGDVGGIKIGKRTNVQDHAMIHCTTNRSTTTIGDDVVIGHRAILHGCRIENEVLIGMGAIILDEALIPSHTIIAAGALVPEGKVLESGFLYAGIPARKLKPLSPEQINSITEGAHRYVSKAAWYKNRGE